MLKTLHTFCTKVKVSIKPPSVSYVCAIKNGNFFLKKTRLINRDKCCYFSPSLSNAAFLHQIIGDYLGEKNDFNEQVLRAFVDLHDFTNLILVQALRWVSIFLSILTLSNLT